MLLRQAAVRKDVLMTRIGGNSSSIAISNLISKTSKELTSSFAKLSSGSRITKAAVDAAGLAIRDSLNAESRVLRKANDNIAYGQSAVAIADSATAGIGDALGRMKELAMQASSGQYSPEQIGVMNDEFQALAQEVDRTVDTTEFNGNKLISSDSSISIQAGSSGGDQIDVENANVSEALSSSGFSSLSLTDAASSRNALDAIGGAIDKVSQARGSLGAFSARLDFAASNNESRIVATEEAASRISDVDVAEETAKLVKNQILNQSQVAMLAQANVERETALRLLS
jgi:flagellin